MHIQSKHREVEPKYTGSIQENPQAIEKDEYKAKNSEKVETAKYAMPLAM
jgi:hypothetical protein